QTGIASGANVDVRVANDRGLLRRGAGFGEQPGRSLGIRLLRSEAVAAVNLREESSQPERVDDRPRRNHWLVREHGQLARLAVVGSVLGSLGRILNRGQRFGD